MPSTRAIAFGAMPRPRQARTSRSRWVRLGIAGFCRVAAPVRANADGAMSMLPLRARRRTSSISVSEPFFGMNAEAPAWVARTTQSGSRCAVTTTITVSGATSRILRQAASPSWRGISMSMITMSGRSSWTSTIPSAALEAVPTQLRPCSVERAKDNSSAKVVWSSTTSTRNSAGAVSTRVIPTLASSMCPPFRR
ncbi:hypothetical protein WBK50_24605 [Pseudonocardia sp. T1-2H]|uniref:hypothetical protein n=1 Tax=Pseudonocardia sp. T1-2H TaxID=3128899 RepID=UPI003100FF98